MKAVQFLIGAILVLLPRPAHRTYERGLKNCIELIRKKNIRILCKMRDESQGRVSVWLGDEKPTRAVAKESISLQICHENSQKPTLGDSAVYAAASVGLVLRQPGSLGAMGLSKASEQMARRQRTIAAYQSWWLSTQ